MCGITGLVLKSPKTDPGAAILAMTNSIRHRGPDGEGYLLAGGGKVIPCHNGNAPDWQRSDLAYLPKESVKSGHGEIFLAFGHRRLAIIDPGESGHQPMCDAQQRAWITYNGELYNYIELRDELKARGHAFVSGSDTEVILHAYLEWGDECVKRFNGMWSFCIYDPQKKRCFASRDRIGVKPFYYVSNQSLFAFASEQKALMKPIGILAEARPEALIQYLLYANLEREPANFFSQVNELWPGHNLVYEIESKELRVSKYFHLSDCISLKNDQLQISELVERVNSAIGQAVKLRLRSDVEVGTCLSGGIDSSALAVIMTKFSDKPISCFTAVFPGQSFNEEKYADLVSARIKGKHFKCAPSAEGLLSEIDSLVYSQDVPIWDSSTYAQYKVMELAKSRQIKVVLDGQGADELFAGYHHHFIAKWNNLLKRGRYASMLRDMNASRTTFPYPLAFYVKQKLKQELPLGKAAREFFFNKEMLSLAGKKKPDRYKNEVNVQLLDDIYRTRLKSFLKCEDRCGMWHSVESRTPFSDDTGLFDLMFSFDGNKKIQKGVSKYLLREALKNDLPPEIYTRYDKKGFDTPMQQWMRDIRPQMLESINEAGFDFLNQGSPAASNPQNAEHNRILFRLFVLSRWKKVFRY